MAKFALLDNHIVTQVMVAETEADLGTLGLLFETVKVDGLEPEPARGWELIDGVWHPPVLTDAAKALWNGAGFDDPEAPKEVEAPKEEAKTDAKKASK